MQPATLRGVLYHLPYDYPALFLDAPDNPDPGLVTGELFELEDAAASLEILDELEDYHGPGQDNEYERQIVNVTTAYENIQTCNVYVYAEGKRNWVKQNGILIDSGDWVKWKREQKRNS